MRALVDPQGRGRQFVAARRLTQLLGTRAGGFGLIRQEGRNLRLAPDRIGAGRRIRSIEVGRLGPDPMPPFAPMPLDPV